MSPSSFLPLTPHANVWAIPHRRMRSRSSPRSAERMSRRRRIRAESPDREPALTSGSQDVPTVEVLMEHHGLALVRPEFETSRLRPRRAGPARRACRALPSHGKSRRPSVPRQPRALRSRGRRQVAARAWRARSLRCSSLPRRPRPSKAASRDRIARSGAHVGPRRRRAAARPRPSQCRSASGSRSVSSSGKLILSTAGVPSSRSTCKTSDTCPSANGAPVRSDQWSAHARRVREAKQAIRRRPEPHAASRARIGSS